MKKRRAVKPRLHRARQAPKGVRRAFSWGDFDIESEIKAILEGRVSEEVFNDGISEYRINGRGYGAHPPAKKGGRWPIYPKYGPRLESISCDVVKAIKAIVDTEGHPEARACALRPFPEHTIEAAVRIYKNRSLQ